MADILMKFDIIKEQPEVWIEHQTRLISGGWLSTEHPKSWTRRVILESEEMLQIAKSGGAIKDFEGLGEDSTDCKPKLVTASNFVTITPQINAMMRFYLQAN